MRKSISLKSILYLLLIALSLSSCGKSQKNPQAPVNPAVNHSPSIPFNPSPRNNSTDIMIVPDLMWSCTDSDGDALTYDIYFGPESNPPLLASNYSHDSYFAYSLNHSTTYFWKVVARDNIGVSVSGPLWCFTTLPTPTTYYIGNIDTHKFHRPTCSYLPDPQNRIIFNSRQEAINAGYIPCLHCNP
jgi:hypothetical protein